MVPDEDERPTNAIDVLLTIQRTQVDIIRSLAAQLQYLDRLHHRIEELAGTEGSYVYLKPRDTQWHVENYLMLKSQMKITQKRYAQMYAKEGVTEGSLQRALSRRKSKTRQKPDAPSE